MFLDHALAMNLTDIQLPVCFGVEKPKRETNLLFQFHQTYIFVYSVAPEN